MSARRVAVVAEAGTVALHGLDGRFVWGEGRSFDPADGDGLRAWAPQTVIAIGAPAPDGPWRTISWAPGAHRIEDAGDRPRRPLGSAGDGLWRRAILPAADSLASLRSRAGSGVFVAGGDEERREVVLGKLRDRAIAARGAARLTLAELERAAVVALFGEPGAPMPDEAAAVLAAGRILVAPRAEPAFGLLAWSDHLPYGHEDELACSADAAQSFPQAFETVMAMGVLAAGPHLSSAVYGRLAVDAELEAAAA
jgi:hypothetical protein